MTEMNSEGKKYLEGLSPYQRAFLRLYPPTQIFAVISWGCAATAWIARALDSHPQIYCVHHANAFWNVLGGSERLDGVPYLRLIASQGHAHLAAGDVHGVSRHHVPELRNTFQELFNAVVVVREPMPRLLSQLALFEKFEPLQGAREKIWDLRYIDDLALRCGVVFDKDGFDSRFFVHAANMLNAVLDEREVGKIYRSEDLTTVPDILSDFVDEITRGKVTPDSGWLDAAMKTEKVNIHQAAPVARELTDWQVDIIRRVVNPHTWEIYETLQYETPAFVRA